MLKESITDYKRESHSQRTMSQGQKPGETLRNFGEKRRFPVRLKLFHIILYLYFLEVLIKMVCELLK